MFGSWLFRREVKKGKGDFRSGSPLNQVELSNINNNVYVYMLFSGFDIEQVSKKQKNLLHTHTSPLHQSQR